MLASGWRQARSARTDKCYSIDHNHNPPTDGRNSRDAPSKSGVVSHQQRPSYSGWRSVGDLFPGARKNIDFVVARQKTLFDDRPVEISELTYVIKQDLAGLNRQIAGLQSLTQSRHPRAARSKADQEGEHNDNVVVMLQGKLADVGANFKDVLELRTRNIQASRSRTENFVSSVSSRSALQAQRSDSPLYSNTTPGSGPGQQTSRSPQPHQDLLTLDEPSATSPSPFAQNSQLLIMEEAQQPAANGYIQQRGEAIDAIERTIGELGSIFGQLASMVSEQTEMIQRIDTNTEDVVDNVQGAQRELIKYWSRVSGNRWLIAKMFGVLMVFFLLWVLISG